jgi:hypothetical protein
MVIANAEKLNMQPIALTVRIASCACRDTALHGAFGGTIVEYLLPAGLVVMACLTGFSIIGGGLDGWLGRFKGEMSQTVSSAQTAELAQQQAAAAAAAAAAMPGAKGGGAASGAAYDLTDPSKVQEALQAVGANGTTSEILASMEKWIQDQLASGDLTEDQANSLTKLANAGHELANAEKSLEDAVLSGQSTLTYNGKTYNVTDFSNQLGMDTGIGMTGVPNMDPSTAMPLTQPFMAAYQDAVSGGLMNNAGAADVVNNLSKQVVSISDLLKWNANSAVTGGKSVDQYKTDLYNGYLYTAQTVGVTPVIPSSPNTASDATHTDSSGICTTGKGSDSGRKCHP